MARIILILFSLMCFTSISFAQIREIPVEVKEVFSSQYPDAESPEYKDNLVNVQVNFSMKGEKMVAAYSNKGMWRDTEKEWSFDQLPDEVKDGFSKSKYAGDEWKVIETKIIYTPGNKEQYRIKAEKNEIQKKYLFFNKSGRLVEDIITL